MKKSTKDKLIKGGIAGAIGAALAGGSAYLLSNKIARRKLSKALGDIEKMGKNELDKLLKSVKEAQKESDEKIAKVAKKINNKKKKSQK